MFLEVPTKLRIETLKRNFLDGTAAVIMIDEFHLLVQNIESMYN